MRKWLSQYRDKSYLFALSIVRFSQSLQSERKEYVLSGQILRSGTAIGALIKEAEFGQSIPDFISKLTIALKEVNNTKMRNSIQTIPHMQPIQLFQ